MTVTLAVLADGANTTESNKLNILGIFSRLNFSEFPAVCPRMVLAIKFSCSAIQLDEGIPIELELLDSDNKSHGDLKTSIERDHLAANMDPAEDRVELNAVITMDAIQFPGPGTFRFAVDMPEGVHFELPLKVALRDDRVVMKDNSSESKGVATD